MSFLDRIKTWLHPAPGRLGGGSGRRYVVDAAGLARPDGKTERLSPGMQIKILQRLSRFAEKESVPISVVFEGKELRAVSHGSDFQGVTVYFVSKPGDLEATFLKMATSGRGAHVTIITDNAKLGRRVLDGGGQLMRLSTFRKALDGGSNRPSGNRPQGNRRGGRRRGGSSQERQERGQQQERRKKPEGDEPRSKDPIHDLIDVVE